MKRRCNAKYWKQYKDYGGRGITYDSRWEKYQGFAKDMFVSWEHGKTLDRIDNNRNYCKENCRWATRKEQNINKRCNHILFFKGKKKTMPEWAEDIGIEFGTLRSRFYRGMSVEKILNKNLYRT